MLQSDVKILSLSQLGTLSEEWRAEFKTVVLCHGTFDLLHPGHLSHLQWAKRQGDVLVVSVTGDAFVSKGPGRPVFSELIRAAMLAALGPVDYVAIIQDRSALPVIEALQPDIYCKGPDYREVDDAGNLDAESIAVNLHGGRLVLSEGPVLSSSALINQHLSPLSSSVQSYLESIRQSFRPDDILDWIERAKNLTVIAVGEDIIDEYIYVVPEGKSAKENIVTYRRIRMEQYEGGINIVASHIKDFVSFVGKDTGNLDAILKRRYVVEPFFQKIFGEVVVPPPPESKPEIKLEAIRDADLTLVVDYGHGLISNQYDADRISEAARFLAISVQSNSLNWGFNLITKWSAADYVVIDEPELRLACGDRYSQIRDLVEMQFERMQPRLFALTRGHNGCLVYDGAGFVESPALADRVVDRIGAGDAFIAVTAPLACAGAPKEVIALVGNLAGAIKVANLGNTPVSASMLAGAIRSALR